MAKFTSERRERLLTLLETGRTVEDAAASVGVSPTTVQRWAARGREAVSPDEAEFAERFDAVRQGDGERLSEDDVVRLLEQAAKKGSVTAMKVLLDRFKSEAVPTNVDTDEFDELKARRRSRVA